MSVPTQSIEVTVAQPVAFPAMVMCQAVATMAVGMAGMVSMYQHAYAHAVAEVAAQREKIRRHRAMYEPSEN